MKPLLLIFFAIGLTFKAQSQCTALSQYPLITLTPTANWSDIDGCHYSGEYAVINVVAGNVYEFSTMGIHGSTILYDTELTLRNAANALIAYNDDYQLTAQSYISWTANYTGTARIHLHEYPCLSNSICSNIRFKVTTPGGGGSPANNNCANATPLTPSAVCNLTSGTTAGATEELIPDPSCDAGTINDVWYSFNSGNYNSLNLTVNLGSANWIGVELFTGCGVLAQNTTLGGNLGNCDFNTSFPNPTVIGGLTPNTNYTFRLFTNVTYDIAGSFTTCLTTPPPPTVSVNSTSICAGQSVTLTATPSTAGGTYLWSNGATTPTITVTPNATTSYSVSYTNNGAGSGSGTVTVNPLPNINAGLDQTACQGANVTLSGTGGSSYTWDNGVSNGVAFVPNTTTTYTVTGTDANGCTNTDQVTVTVAPNPTISGNTVLCPSTTSQLTGSGTAAANNAWTSSNAAVASISNTGVVTAISFGTSTITYTANTGCSVTTTVNVSNPTAPAFNPIAAVCAGGVISLPGASTNNVQGTWSPAVNNTQTTTYTFTPSAGQCATNATLAVNVNPLPTINAGLDQTACQGANVTLSGTGGSTYSWNNGVSNGVAFVPNTTTTYTVTGTDANGCTNTDQVTVTVAPNPTLSGNTVICPNTTSQLSANANPAASNAWTTSNAAVATISNTGLVTAVSFGTSTITFTNNNGCTATTTINVSNPTAPIFNPIAAVCAGGVISLPVASTNNIQGTWSPAVNNTQTTTYTFTPSVGQCATTAQQTVNVNPNPTISGVNTLCPNASIQLTGSGTAAANNAWVSGTPGNGTVTSTGLVTGVNAGNTIITYTNANGCTATQTVTVNANPTANAGQDQTLCAGGNATLTGTANGGSAPYTYSWNNGVQQGVPFPLNATGTYTVTVTDGNGCTSSDNVTLTSTSIDWANLQWPASGTVCLGQTHNVYGQIYVAGITNGPGQAAGIIAQVGVNSTNTDPSTWPANAWSNATFNTQAGNNDEFTAGIGNLLSAGTHYYTFRYSLGQGCPFYYGGFNGGAWNGSSNTNGALTINAAPNATSAVNACESYTWYGQTYTQSGTFTHTVPSGAGCDSVLYLNLTIFNNVSGPTIQQTACDSYTWNGQTYFQSGTYTFNGSSQNGCDSTATLSLTINNAPSNVQVSLNQGTFTVTAQNASNFAWMDCATNTLIPGETNATFTPTISGSYAAMVSNACGSDTTTCEPIEVQGISETESELIAVYPNPSNGIFTVASKGSIIQEVTLYSVNGELIWRNANNSHEITIDLSEYARGTYMLQVSTNQEARIFRLIKQ
jgi:hypothetical protein